MNKENKIVLIKSTKSEALTKQQKSFNQLNKRISTLQSSIIKEEERLSKLLIIYSEKIAPISLKGAKNKLKLAHLLSDSLGKHKFGVRQKETIISAIIFLCEMAFSAVEPSKKDEALFNKWSKISYKQQLEEAEKETKDYFTEQFKDLFGLDIDFDNYKNDPESYAKFEEEIKAKMAESGYGNPLNQGTTRKKTIKQLEKEKQVLEEQNKQQKSIRGIYLALAKVLHPDMASNEEDRVEKENLMKQVTAAYAKKDLPTLLRLESYWIKSTNNSIDDISEEKLNLYINALKVQVKDLEEELWLIKGNPKYNILGDLVFSTEKIAIKEIDEQKKYLDQLLTLQKQDYDFLASTNNKVDFFEVAESISDQQNQY